MTARNDQPDLYRVQTTAGESVVVQPYGPAWQEVKAIARLWDASGVSGTFVPGPSLKLNTLTRLHLLTDAELQARDDALLERVAANFDGRQFIPTDIGGSLMVDISPCDICAAAIRAMKGQTHER
jgi:hypothetical protein